MWKDKVRKLKECGIIGCEECIGIKSKTTTQDKNDRLPLVSIGFEGFGKSEALRRFPPFIAEDNMSREFFEFLKNLFGFIRSNICCVGMFDRFDGVNRDMLTKTLFIFGNSFFEVFVSIRNGNNMNHGSEKKRQIDEIL